MKETKPSVQLLPGPRGERDPESTGEALSRAPHRHKEGVTPLGMGLIVRCQKEYFGNAEDSTGYLEEELKATQGIVSHESGLGKNKHRRMLGGGARCM